MDAPTRSNDDVFCFRRKIGLHWLILPLLASQPRAANAAPSKPSNGGHVAIVGGQKKPSRDDDVKAASPPAPPPSFSEEDFKRKTRLEAPTFPRLHHLSNQDHRSAFPPLPPLELLPPDAVNAATKRVALRQRRGGEDGKEKGTKGVGVIVDCSRADSSSATLTTLAANITANEAETTEFEVCCHYFLLSPDCWC